MANPIHPDVRIGHVHLRVADLERAIHFYRDVLGFELTQRYGDKAAFLAAGGYHHHIGLHTWGSGRGKQVSPPRLAHPAYTPLRLLIRREPSLPTHSDECCAQVFASKARPIMV